MTIKRETRMGFLYTGIGIFGIIGIFNSNMTPSFKYLLYACLCGALFILDVLYDDLR